MNMLARAAQAMDSTASPRWQRAALIGTAVAALLTLVSFTVIVREATERAAGLASHQGSNQASNQALPQARQHALNHVPNFPLSQSPTPSAPPATQLLGAATVAAR